MNNEFPSIYLLAALFGWLVAHLVKFVFAWLASGGKDKDLGIFFRAGGMPSSHSAVIVAVLTTIGAREGVGSAIFGLGLAVALILLYDALNVRRSVGEQGDALRKLAAKSQLDATFFTAYGHTFLEVTVGSALGVGVAWILLQIL